MPKMYRISTLSTLSASALLLAACADPSTHGQLDLSTGQWIDLSYDLSDETVYWPTATPFRLDTVSFGFTPAGFFYSAFAFTAAEHGGTHLDAPIHFGAEKRTVDTIPANDLNGPLVVIPLADAVGGDADYLVSIDDITSWETLHGPIPNGAMVMLNTGHGAYWPDAASYLGTDQRGPEAVPLLRFPGLAPETADWLVTNRSIKGIGLDTPSIDYGQSREFESHQILARENILVFENVANLDAAPPTGGWLVAAPMKIKGGSGGPARLFAYVPANN